MFQARGFVKHVFRCFEPDLLEVSLLYAFNIAVYILRKILRYLSPSYLHFRASLVRLKLVTHAHCVMTLCL